MTQIKTDIDRVKIYTERGWFKEAGDAAERCGLRHDAVELYNKGIEYYQDQGDLISAADCAARVGQDRKAIKLYNKAIEQRELIRECHKKFFLSYYKMCENRFDRENKGYDTVTRELRVCVRILKSMEEI